MELFADLDLGALLAAEEAGVLEARRLEVDKLLRLLAWCDAHSVDPQTQPGAVPIAYGGDRLVRVGGPGTPEVSDLCFAEFAVASHAGVIATMNRAGDALDLRHRLPRLWAAVQDLRVEVWVARKIATLSRKLSRTAVEIVDVATAAGADLMPGRLIELAEAKVIEADPDTHRARIAADEANTGVWMRRRRPGQSVTEVDAQPSVQPITLRLPLAGAVEFTTSVDDLARAMADQHVPADEDDVLTMGQWRARAVELLADPHAAVRFLDGPSPATGGAEVADTETPPPSPAQNAPRPGRTADLAVHISAAVLAGQADGVARVEGIGPLLLEQVAELLRHRNVVVKPVIDLNAGAAVDSYEHPTACKERTMLRTGGDVFPHSGSRSRRLDHDHPTPYDENGPPGQTGDHNDAPLTRRHHRAKTHAGHRVRQLAPGAYRWETRHGLTRVVTRYGTTVVEGLASSDRSLLGELHPQRFEPVLDLQAA
ncbi:hypothetical protein JK386_11390 [Nocardioides sp. zg-536]|uniref:DUF222 domain-containing protein n=1 Tax=Nocardioides faecalis TaxID=2803858 RepID=A0A938Y9A6_9ACTN|nr:hypothetical protein [Nocardioides faecalis]MBM9460508.1 hypothetical protein [Nocardioides faecalis]QVI57557.1 hypothetical protein KG111_10680 [Nocardioides faecalis]